jgi:transcription factor S
MMMPKKEKNSTYFLCSCGEREGGDASVTIKESGNTKDDMIAVAEDRNINPLVDAICPKCKHPRAYHWAIQTRSADEPESLFFKCEKCNHTWRIK